MIRFFLCVVALTDETACEIVQWVCNAKEFSNLNLVHPVAEKSFSKQAVQELPGRTYAFLSFSRHEPNHSVGQAKPISEDIVY